MPTRRLDFFVISTVVFWLGIRVKYLYWRRLLNHANFSTNERWWIMKIHNCPDCNTYSGECINIIQNAPNHSEEILKCSICSWSGTWSEMKVQDIPHEVIPGVEPISNYYVLHSDTARITYTGGCCPHCGGSDPFCWCMILWASCSLV